MCFARSRAPDEVQSTPLAQPDRRPLLFHSTGSKRCRRLAWRIHLQWLLHVRCRRGLQTWQRQSNTKDDRNQFTACEHLPTLALALVNLAFSHPPRSTSYIRGGRRTEDESTTNTRRHNHPQHDFKTTEVWTSALTGGRPTKRGGASVGIHSVGVGAWTGTNTRHNLNFSG